LRRSAPRGATTTTPPTDPGAVRGTGFLSGSFLGVSVRGGVRVDMPHLTSATRLTGRRQPRLLAAFQLHDHGSNASQRDRAQRTQRNQPNGVPSALRPDCPAPKPGRENQPATSANQGKHTKQRQIARGVRGSKAPEHKSAGKNQKASRDGREDARDLQQIRLGRCTRQCRNLFAHQHKSSESLCPLRNLSALCVLDFEIF